MTETRSDTMRLIDHEYNYILRERKDAGKERERRVLYLLYYSPRKRPKHSYIQWVVTLEDNWQKYTEKQMHARLYYFMRRHMDAYCMAYSSILISF